LGEKSSLMRDGVPVPEGHYEDESMKSTVVPNRNMILLSIATAWSIASGLQGVAYAAHSGDHAIYPDCRPAFADAMNEAIRLCDYSSQELVRPFVSLTKADIVRVGASLGVPFEKTWSCYNGRKLHCGKCGTCVERIEAFELAGVPDPTEYKKLR
jgi:7-cyano-7-deazaguanine synthase